MLYMCLCYCVYVIGDGLDMYEVTSISKDKPVVEVLVQEFRDNYRDADSVGK